MLIRQLDALGKIVDHTTSHQQRELILVQATMILRASEESVPEVGDRADVRREHEHVVASAAQMAAASEPVSESGGELSHTS